MFFFFQAEDGIRDSSVTGVQTCALPIYRVVLAGSVDPAMDLGLPASVPERAEAGDPLVRVLVVPRDERRAVIERVDPFELPQPIVMTRDHGDHRNERGGLHRPPPSFSRT